MIDVYTEFAVRNRGDLSIEEYSTRWCKLHSSASYMTCIMIHFHTHGLSEDTHSCVTREVIVTDNYHSAVLYKFASCNVSNTEAVL